MLHLHIYLADVFSRYATCHQHASANEPHADEQRSPSVYRMPREVFIQGISDHADGYEDKRHTKIGDELEGLDGERRDALEGERQHLAQRIFRLSGKALTAVVIYRSGRVTH